MCHVSIVVAAVVVIVVCDHYKNNVICLKKNVKNSRGKGSLVSLLTG